MAKDTTYDYRLEGASLLRAPPHTLQIEIFRPAKDEWVEHASGVAAVIDWYEGMIVQPETVDELSESLKRLEASH